MSDYARPTNTANPILDPVLYWRLSAFALTAVALLGIVMAAVYGGDAAAAEGQPLSFGGTDGLGLTWAHNVVHVALALAAFAFGFAPVPGRAAKAFAVAFGVVYAALGIAGFLWSNPLGGGMALNLGHATNGLHLLLGAWALAAGIGARYD